MKLRTTRAAAPLWLFVFSVLGWSAQRAPASSELERALHRALDQGWEELRVEAECVTEAGFHTLSVLGSGVGIWDKAKQFRVTGDAIKAQLEAFRRHDFAGMDGRYGGKNDPGVARQPPRIVCRVMLDIDGAKKEVIQFHGGRQSEALRRLADRLFELSRSAAETGIEAEDLTDGLAKVASGALAPETLQITVQRRSSGEGWLLRIEGRRATTRLFRQAEGFGEPVVLQLDDNELGELAGLLHDLRFDDLPTNLYAEHYTDLGVHVLNHEKQIQARAFGRLTPTSFGEKQERYDRIFGELVKLQKRVLEEGQIP